MLTRASSSQARKCGEQVISSGGLAAADTGAGIMAGSRHETY